MAALTDEQRMILESVRRLAEEHFTENACTWQPEAPWENVELLAEYGFLGLNFDEQYGGGGMTELEALLVTETVSRVCPDTGMFLNAQQLIGPRAVETFGTEAAKQQYLPPVLAGDDAIAIAISEPGAGSDVNAMDSSFEADGDGYTLEGEKTWVSDVPHSSAMVVWAKHENGSIGSAIVEFDQPGVAIANHSTNMAGQPQTHLYIEDVHVPAENVLLGPDGEFKRQLEALNWERLGNAAMITGQMGFAIDRALSYAEGREQFGQPIGEFQGIEWKLADMTKHYKAAQALLHTAAEEAIDRDRKPGRLSSSVATLYASEIAEHVVSEAIQIHGANGYQQGHPLEYLYRLVRGWRIGAGTDEIQKNQIAAAIKRDGLDGS